MASLKLTREQSPWAKEGDALHEIAATCLDFDMDPAEMVGTRRGDFVLDAKDARLMQEVVDWWREQGFSRQGVEEKLACESVYPGRRGTVDAWGVVGNTVTILDWKWGRGIPVSPEGNLQMIEYAYAVWTERVWKHMDRHARFRLCIAQPRIVQGVQVW